MKWLHLITVFVFGSFVFVNLNDHDFLKWTLIYLPLAIIGLLQIFKPIHSNLILIYAAGLIIYLVYNIEDLVQWTSSGMPSMMDLESENVESVREFFGTLVAMMVSLFYYMINRKRRIDRSV